MEDISRNGRSLCKFIMKYVITGRVDIKNHEKRCCYVRQFILSYIKELYLSTVIKKKNQKCTEKLSTTSVFHYRTSFGERKTSYVVLHHTIYVGECNTSYIVLHHTTYVGGHNTLYVVLHLSKI